MCDKIGVNGRLLRAYRRTMALTCHRSREPPIVPSWHSVYRAAFRAEYLTWKGTDNGSPG
jgi:hypothetical protein